MKINVEAAVQLANPLPREEQLDQLFGTDLSHSLRIDILNLREGRMTETQKSPPSGALRAADEPTVLRRAKPPRPSLATALTSFLLIIAVGVTGFVLLRGDDKPPVASGVSVGESFLEARQALNAENTIRLFAVDATVADLEVRAVADYEQQYDWYQRLDWVWELDECTETDSVAGPVVNCTYTHHNAWMDARGVEPIGGSFDLMVVDGLIVELSHNFVQREFGNSWDTFRIFVQNNHPEDFDTMYDTSGTFQAPRYTPESLDLWELYTDEFVASQG